MLQPFSIICLQIFMFGEAFGSDDPKVLNTPLGKLEGVAEISRSGRQYFSFKGIRYAEPVQMFKKSQPVKPWTGIKKATEFGSNCASYNAPEKKVIGSSDCLFLNVYSHLNKVKVPVMVWIHPGGFEFGQSNDYDPKYFMDEDILIVTINYRLGALGFLYTGNDDDIPGNLGMRDQVLALEWVQKNIEHFFGDPTKVTIFGNSAGSASVEFHCLSPLSKGLFSNAITMSGSALAPWGLQKFPQKNAKKFAEVLSCPTNDLSKMVECIKGKPVEQIILAQTKLADWFIFPFSNFMPVIEQSKNSKYEKFLGATPLEILQSGNYNRVPLITGVVEDEGLFFSVPIIALNESIIEEMNEEWSRAFPAMLYYNKNFPNKEAKDNRTRAILAHYFGHEEVGEDTWSSLTDLASDRIFRHSIDKSARLHAKYTSVYTYELTFPVYHSPALLRFFGVTGDHGVCHVDELQFLFHEFLGAPGISNEPEQQEAFEFSRNFVKLWVSFAYEGKPTATWGPAMIWEPVPSNIEDNPIKTYILSTKTDMVRDGHVKERIAFWDQLNVDDVSDTDSEERCGKKEEL